MTSYIYCTNNKYNLKKCVNILKMRHIPYTIYDEYFACAQKMEEAEFNKDYYCKFIGTAEVRRFKNNDVEVRIEKKKCISANGIEL